ncbi:MAG: pentapeptide repeat-containing protein [Pirellulales bacterium]|nr:pentapeptide repeat-containing protein [Pirellulales bacterium]
MAPTILRSGFLCFENIPRKIVGVAQQQEVRAEFESTEGQTMAESRASYEESIRRIQELGYLGSDEQPPLPDHLPQYDDDEPLGLTFFRTRVGEGDDLSNLTIPRTFFGRSEIRDTSFRNTDLSESNLCWNDFIDVDFTGAVLTRSDMRASIYERVNFKFADLRHADLRRSKFETCTFDDALMDGAVLTRGQGTCLLLDDLQRRVVAWSNDEGPEPPGG